MRVRQVYAQVPVATSVRDASRDDQFVVHSASDACHSNAQSGDGED